MSKITLNDVGNLVDATTAKTTINNNSATIVTAFDNTLSRDGTPPNQMEAPLDMNSQQIINLPVPLTSDAPLRLQDLSDFIGGGTITNIPPGGNTNDVLTKASNTDFDVDWSSAASEVVAGLNISVTGASPATVSTISNPTFTTVATPTLVLNGTTLSTKTGTGALVLQDNPSIVGATLFTPALGTPTAGVMTNVTGTAAGLTAGHVTTNANLTGDVTSVGNATTLSAGSASNLNSGTLPAARMPALTGDVTTSAGAVATAIGATKVTSAMLNSDVFSTPHSWSGGQSFTAPALGTPASGVATNLTGTASGLTAGNVTTNANLTGDVTSVGNATTLTNAPVIAKVLTGYTSGAGTISAADSILGAIQKLNGNDATNANLTGDVTSVGNATTLTNAPVIAKVLTGYTSGAGTVAATDSILQAIQKLNGNDGLKATLASANAFTDTTASTSTSTGAITTLGGVGIAKDLFWAGAAYTQTTPAPTASTGTFTTATTVVRVKQYGKLVHYYGKLVVTTIGTAVGRALIAMPVTAFSSGTFPVAVALIDPTFTSTTCSMGWDSLSTLSISLTGITSGQTIHFNGFYEAA